MDMQAQKGREQMKALPLKEKFKNFFYYYKWHVIIAVFLIAAVVLTLVECSKRVQEDLIITYFSSDYISENTAQSMRDFFGYDYCIDDINGDSEKNVALLTYSGMDENVINKYMVELAMGDSMAFIFDQYYYDMTMRSQPDSVDFAYDITKNAELKAHLGLTDKPLYFVVKSVYDAEQGDEIREKMHDNAIKIYNILAGDDMTAVYFSTGAFDDAVLETLRETFAEYADNINGVEQKIVGISQVREINTDKLGDYAETINSGNASAFLTDAAYYEAFKTAYPDVIEDSEDISAHFNLPDGSLYYIVRKMTGSEAYPEKAALLHDNAVRILENLR